MHLKIAGGASKFLLIFSCFKAHQAEQTCRNILKAQNFHEHHSRLTRQSNNVVKYILSPCNAPLHTHNQARGGQQKTSVQAPLPTLFQTQFPSLTSTTHPRHTLSFLLCLTTHTHTNARTHTQTLSHAHTCLASLRSCGSLSCNNLWYESCIFIPGVAKKGSQGL